MSEDREKWKKLGQQCGKSLDKSILDALSSFDMEELAQDDFITIKHRIYSALANAKVDSSRRKCIARDLSFVFKYDIKTLDSLLIFFGLTPFKLQCRLPSYNTIELTVARLCCSDLPHSIEEGKFVFIRMLRGVQIFVYSFKNPVSCSSVNESRLHGRLSVPRKLNMISIQEIHDRKSELGAGNVYLHLNDKATRVKYPSPGECTVSFSINTSASDTKASDIKAISESYRTGVLKTYLEKVLPNMYEDIKVESVEPVRKKALNNFCPFSGGGDLKLTRKDNIMLLMTHLQSEYGHSSPTHDNEYRETLDMETKVASSKTNSEVRLQLQADMYNVLVREFMSKLNAADDDQFDNISKLLQISIYGMSFGPSHPVDVLKLTADFGSKELQYICKYTSTSGFPQEPIIDSCIAAVLDRLTKRSPPPPQH